LSSLTHGKTDLMSIESWQLDRLGSRSRRASSLRTSYRAVQVLLYGIAALLVVVTSTYAAR
jgi:hypothetical protein